MKFYFRELPFLGISVQYTIFMNMDKIHEKLINLRYFVFNATMFLSNHFITPHQHFWKACQTKQVMDCCVLYKMSHIQSGVFLLLLSGRVLIVLLVTLKKLLILCCLLHNTGGSLVVTSEYCWFLLYVKRTPGRKSSWQKVNKLTFPKYLSSTSTYLCIISNPSSSLSSRSIATQKNKLAYL